MKHITSVKDIPSLGTILAVFAHPDDETLTCGGILSLAAQNGQRVTCLTATKGEKGIQDAARWPAEQLGDIRTKELEAALDCLGVREHYFLGFEDGELSGVAEQVGAATINKFIKEIQPDTILTFPLDGLTGHPDHQAICRWTSLAMQQSDSHAALFHAATCQEDYESAIKKADKKYDFYFAIEKPHLVKQKDCTICLCLPADTLEQKIAAIECMESQYEKVLEEMGRDWAHKAYANETFIRVDDAA